MRHIQSQEAGSHRQLRDPHDRFFHRQRRRLLVPAYPPWNAPAALFPQGVTNPQVEWSEAEADSYLDWLASTMDDRIATMFDILGMDRNTIASADLSVAGQEAYTRLRQPKYSGVIGRRARLKAPGRALAADMGLLVARWLLNDGNGAISWRVCRESKRHMNYNLPVLCGVSVDFLDPVGGSIANAHGCVCGRRSPDIWLQTYEYWIERLQEP